MPRESAKTRYCFTYHCPASWSLETAVENGPKLLDAAATSGDFSAMVFQLEICPTTQRPHYQGFALLCLEKHKRGVRLTGAKAILDPIFQNCHIEATRGSTAAASAYCEKDDTRAPGGGPWRFGDLTRSQGTRSDLLNVKDSVDANVDTATLWEEHFQSMVRYHKSIEVYRNLKIARRTEQTELIIMVGPTAVGKTTWIMDTYPDAFWVSPPTKGQSLWWDGYAQQETVVLDEFRGWWFPYSILLQLANKSPYKVQQKGMPACEFNSKRIIIATNNHPQTFYTGIGDTTALERRIYEIQVWTGFKEFTRFTNTDGTAWDNYRKSELWEQQLRVTSVDFPPNH